LYGTKANYLTDFERMHMTQMITRRLGFFLVLLVLLAACGSVRNQATAPEPTGVAAQRPPAPPAPTTPPAPSQATQATDAQPPAAATAAAPAPTTATTVDGIAQGLTPEGYHFLGSADAPVTFQDFSDFL
jgi:hypothetical protein